MQTTRKSFSNTKRMQIAHAQGWKCKLCDRMLHWTFEIDHILALMHGGSNNLTNLQALCLTCHRIKTLRERGLIDAETQNTNKLAQENKDVLQIKHQAQTTPRKQRKHSSNMTTDNFDAFFQQFKYNKKQMKAVYKSL